MSFELFPLASTRERRLRIVARGLGSTLSEGVPDLCVHRSLESDDAEVRSTWNMFLGLLVVVAVSGSFWGGVGWLIGRLAR